MKFSKLYLKAFGPYTERVIDFTGSAASLHILYGLNEAGKSSLLRAIRALLYGIPERTQDNFLHENPTLRIGGVVSNGAGRQLAMLRRKGQKQTLRQWNGKAGADCEGELLPDNAVLDFLSGIEEAQFSKIFGIDRDELIEGGRTILKGEGDVGESLFEAGAGLVGLRRLRDALEEEGKSIFSRGASKPLINSIIGELDDAKRVVRDAMVRTDEWMRRDEAYTNALTALGANKQVIGEKRLARERLARILRNLPVIARREEYLKELADLSEVPDLALNSAEKRAAAVAEKANAERQRDETEKTVGNLETQLEDIKIPAGYVERGVLIQGVYSRLGAFQQAELEIPGLEARKHSLLQEAKVKLSDLGLVGELSDAERFRPRKSHQTKIRNLIKEHSDFCGRMTELQRKESELQTEIKVAEDALSARPQPQDPTNLQEAVQAALEHADSERRLAELARDVSLRTEELQRKARSLGERTAAELRDLRAPAKATLQRLQQEADAISRDREVATSRLAQRRTDLLAREGEKKELEARGLVPSEEELSRAREHRDRGWQLIREGYIERTADPKKLGKGYGVGTGLPAGYEQAVQGADKVADGLRLDTERTTKHTIVLRRIAELSAAIAADEAELSDLNARSEKWQKELGEICNSVGTSVATVRELEEWLGERDAVVASLGELEQRQREAEELRSALTVAQTRLAVEAEAYSASPSGNETFNTLLGRTRKLLDRVRTEAADYDEAKKRVKDLKDDLVGQQERLQKLNSEWTEWRSRWAAAVTVVGFAKSIDPEEAEDQLSLLEEFFKTIDELHRIGHSVSEKQATVHRYSEEVRAIAIALALDWQDKSVADVVALLFSQYQEAVKNTQRHEQVSEQLEHERSALQKAQDEVALREKELANLCAAAGVTDMADLPTVEEKSRSKGELQSKISQLEEQLTEQNSSPLDRILEEAAAVDQDTLNVEIPGLEEEIKDLEAGRDSLVQQVHDAEGALKEVDGSAKAAEAAQRTQDLLAKLTYATEDYTRLKVSSFVIARAIEAYRQKHQGPILKRAGEYFATLTCGSFKGLDVDFGEDERQLLLGVRSNGKHVVVEGMSEGTRDQLYLALRLAAIERHLEAGQPVPIIVDDILVQFDNDRAEAAFEALSMLATRTQVILLTHHEHLLPLAEKVIAKDVLAIHRLEAPSLAEAA